MLEWLTSRTKYAGAAKGTPLREARYVVFDTELTSLDQRSNRLLSVGAVVMKGASILVGEQFYRVVDPGVPVPAQSVVVHGLRTEDVKSGAAIHVALEDLQKFVEGAVLVGHFVEIDLKIMRKEMTATGLSLENPAVCTARMHDWLLRHGRYTEDLQARLEQLDLATVGKSYGVEIKDAHHALGDAFATARVWQKMLYAAEAHGLHNLGDLLRAAGSSG